VLGARTHPGAADILVVFFSPSNNRRHFPLPPLHSSCSVWGSLGGYAFLLLCVWDRVCGDPSTHKQHSNKRASWLGFFAGELEEVFSLYTSRCDGDHGSVSAQPPPPPLAVAVAAQLICPSDLFVVCFFSFVFWGDFRGFDGRRMVNVAYLCACVFSAHGQGRGVAMCVETPYCLLLFISLTLSRCLSESQARCFFFSYPVHTRRYFRLLLKYLFSPVLSCRRKTHRT